MKPKTKTESKRLNEYCLYKPFKHITKLKRKMKRQTSKVRRKEWGQLNIRE